MGSNILILVVFIVYLSLLVLWGVYQGRKVRSGNDFAIAGRRLPGWAAALSERATGESSWALLGLPGAAYATGLTEIWTAAGCVAGIITAWIFLAWRLRDEAEKYNVTTFSGYIEARHGDAGRSLRMLVSFTIVFFFFFYVGAQFLGGGKTLYTLFGIRPSAGMLITAAVIIPYTIYGGFRSVVYTDVIQATLMIITLVVAPVAGIIYIMNEPGLYASGISEALAKSGESYTRLTGAAGGFGAGLLITGGFSWFFGYLGGLPQLTTRFMAIKDARQARKARNIGIAWTIIAYAGALSLGWIGLAIFGPAGLKDPEYVMPSVLLRLFPPVIAAILITGAIAAMISTADSLLIVSATELSETLTGKKNEKHEEKRETNMLRRHRLTTASLALIALALSYVSPSKVIFTIVSYVWAGVGCTFSVIILLTLFWKRFHGRAATVTVITGLLFTIFWISGGFEQHYKVTRDKANMLAERNIISSEERSNLLIMENQKFAGLQRFEAKLAEKLGSSGEGERIKTISSAFSVKGIPARLMTFIVCFVTAVLSTLLLPPHGKEG